MELALSPCRHAVTGTVAVPGSKSYTNRALVLAALASGESRLEGVSPGEDTRLLAAGLRQLGVEIDGDGDALVVRGVGRALTARAREIDLGLAGTSYRFLLPLCAAAREGEVILTGSARMCERPIEPLVTALEVLGADIQYAGRSGFPPLRVRGVGPLRGGPVTVRGDVSSQYVSALLLAASLMRAPLELEVERLRGSRSYLEMTVECLADFGREVERVGDVFRLENGSPAPTVYAVDGDASGASYFWALAAVTGGRVRVENLRPRSAQGDLEFAAILERMGCTVVRDDRGFEVCGPEVLRAIDVDMASLPDTAQTLAVVAAVAEGETEIRGLHSLKYKETDRLRALECELRRMGVECAAAEDSFRVRGGAVRGATIHTYGDHRMAMAFAVLGARVEGVRIEDPGVVEKSFPSFWVTLSRLGVESHAG